MPAPTWRRVMQFRLRTLLLAVTVCCLLSGGFLVWWRTPFFTERLTTSSGWEHLDLLQASLPPSGQIVFRERYRVYRDARGEYVKHGPFEVFDSRGKLLRREHWSHGKLHGPWIDWDLNDRELARGEYWQGEKHGDWVSHLRDKTWVQTTYERGVRRDAKHYVGAGVLYIHRRYDEAGNLIEAVRRAPSGNNPIVERRRYMERQGVRWQVCEAWYPNGVKQVEGSLRDGLEAGEWVLWNQDGSVARRWTFKAGRLVRSDGTLTPPILPEDPGNDSPAVGRIRHVLDDETRLEFIRTPCNYVMQYLENTHTIPIHIDQTTLREAGRDPGTRFTVNLNVLSLRAALQVLLEAREMAPVVRRELLLITTPEDAATWSDQTGLPEMLADPATPFRENLRQAARVKWEQTPLREAIDYFRGMHSLPVRLDESAFEDPDGILERPTTLELRGLSAASVLGFLLDEHDLACVEQNGQLLVRPR